MANKQLRIAHLYPDIMNTYGDWGNLVALTYRAQARGFKVVIDSISLGDTHQPGTHHFYFFGGGQDRGQTLVADHLAKIAGAIRQDVENQVPLLAVCGGYQLLGTKYTTAQGKEVAGADILPVTTSASPKRAMNNVVLAINPNLDIDRTQASTLVGFENHSGQTHLQEQAQPLGRVIKGHGNNGQDGTEGVVHHKAVGTYLHGSCLPKNPHLADWLLGHALKAAGNDKELTPLDDSLEWQAHQFATNLKP